MLPSAFIRQSDGYGQDERTIKADDDTDLDGRDI
jgi:hypothetical protein